MAPRRGVKRALSKSDAEEHERSPKQTKLSQFTGFDEVEVRPVKARASRTSASKKTPAHKLYKDTINTIDKTFKQMVKNYKPNPNGWYGITSDDFSKAMARHLSDVEKLKDDSPSLAFNLLVDLGEHAYGDLEACVKSSGFGDTEEPFKEMDQLLSEIIAARREEERTAAQVAGIESKNDTTTETYKFKASRADLGCEEKSLRDLIGPKHPNKQLRRKLDIARLADLQTMFSTRRERRATTEDWAGNALNDLAETRARIEQYGIGEHYFRESINLLAAAKGVEPPPIEYDRPNRSKLGRRVES
ncbi:hypothetical protein F5Y14DRAFT_186585 [Nemania sp. NC0429]|nr:hypothetical protein F5Y14DRAFT_186585 [Nemania sp. NC0429]